MSYKRTGTTHNSRQQPPLAVSESRRPHSASRHPLNPIYPNIRRAKSRNALVADADPEDGFPTGSKRKRVASGPENANTHYATLQARPGKRLKQADDSQSDDDDDNSHSDTEHDVYDAASRGEDLNSDEYLDKAPEWKLLKLRKDQLLSLYERATGGHGRKDADNLGKQDLAKAIIHARSKARNKLRRAKNAVLNRFSRRRIDVHPQAPHTPDSDDVDRAKFSRAIAQHFGLKRNTTRESKAPGTLGRSFSLDTLMPITTKLPKGHSSQSTLSVVSSSSAGDIPPTPLTPPRTRGRKLSKRREKRVGFVESVDGAVDQSASEGGDGVSDDASANLTSRLPEPSPRRLRTRSTARSTSSVGSASTNSSIQLPRRLLPRQAKDKARTSNKDDTELDDGDSGGEELPASSELGDDDAPSGSDDESTPEPRLVRQPKDSKASKSLLQTPPPEDDDMESQHESGEETVDGYQPTPRKLRNGKILRKDQAPPPPAPAADDDSSELSELSEMDTSVTEESSDSEIDDKDDEDYVEEDSAVTMVTAATAGADDEGSTFDTGDDADAEGEDEEINLEEQTATTLARYRKEQLVRLCESKGVDAEGTKPQLVKVLLQWRSRRQSVSSGGSTVCAPSTAVPRPAARRRKQQVPHDGKPVLERSDRVHVSQPRTPPVADGSESLVETIHANHRGEEEEGLELDLESLGLEDKEIPPEKLTKLEKIGSGGFKDVYTGKLKNRKVAIAEFRGQLTAMDIKELKLLRNFDHPNIVRFLGVSVPQDTKTNPVMMVSELCSNGDLFDYVRNVPAPSYEKVLKIMHDIASGLMYLHTHKPSIIHRDCKSSNILVTSKGSAKIADFGLAKVKQSTRSMVRSLVGTVNWQAPELWHAHPKYDHKVDVFSCGMVFWEILTWHWREKKYPWEGMNEHAIYEAVGSKKQRPSVSGLRKQWSPEIVGLMERMWAQDPHDRPTITQVVEELETMS